MGSVQKLATVVIVGLVALATLLVVYLANEPNRRASEAVAQEEVAIERGMRTYITNCVQCHGPAGEGYSEPGAKGTGRIGMPLGGSTEAGLAATERNQTKDPNARQARYNLIVNTIQNGRGLMPAFGRGAEGGAILNDEQINELALMIQNVDWDRVYNETIAADGGYPTFAPAPAPPGGQQAPAAAQAQAPQAQAPQPAAGGPITVESHDIFFSPTEVTIPANTDVTFSLPNLGAAPHNFSIDALNISVDLPPGETKEQVINAPAGTYEYYCNVPGHREAGMVGTLTVEAGAGAAAAPAGGAAAVQGTAPAATEATVVSRDIFFEPTSFTIPANTDVKVTLPNEGAAPHNFSIDALGISVDLPPGETQETTINAPAGTYEYYCNVPGHREAGMVGTLTVEAGGGGTPPAATPEAQATPAGTPAAAPAQPVTVGLLDTMRFDPAELTIPANTDVVVDVRNDGVAPHSFVIDALNVNSGQLPGGGSTQVTINAAPGTYEYYCDVPGHREAGMVGTLTVVEGGGQAAAPPVAPPAAAGAASPAGTSGGATGQEFTVTSRDIFFEPKELTIPANRDVRLRLPNEGAAPHNFSIDALGISVDLPPGAEGEATINAAPGTYEYYCNVPGHREAGMVGTLTVQ